MAPNSDEPLQISPTMPTMAKTPELCRKSSSAVTIWQLPPPDCWAWHEGKAASTCCTTVARVPGSRRARPTALMARKTIGKKAKNRFQAMIVAQLGP